MGRLIVHGLLLACAAQLLNQPVWAQVCAVPGKDNTFSGGGVVNSYFQASGNLTAGSTSLALGAAGPAPGLTTPPTVGDLLLIIQMQDGTINSSNNSSYGNGSGSGAGSTSTGSAGLHEFVTVSSVSGATVGFSPALTNSYFQANSTASQGQRRYQVIRVPQYTTATLSGVTAPAWNGLTGGVVAVDVRDTLTLGSGTVDGVAGRAVFVAGKGFRGSAGRQLTGGGSADADYATQSASNYHGGKGEGINGTPRYVSTKTGDWSFRGTAPASGANLAVTDTGVEGYPGGSYARGAPGNAGGGGTDGRTTGTSNDENAGGGGGGNYGPGGRGGRPWNDPLKDTGGRGGGGFAGTLAFNRVFMGGGGGAGGTNNGTADNTLGGYSDNLGIQCSAGAGLCSSGGAGGGIVILRARNFAGAGVIDVRGAHGYNVTNDAGGGGGGAGSVVLYSALGGSAVADLSGGDGGNAWLGGATGLGNRHGPGGGGGGGFLAYAPSGSLSVSATFSGGNPGRTMSDLRTTYDADGFNGGLSTFQSPSTPGVPPGALCDPNLSLAKSNGASALASPGTTSYTLTVINSGIGPTIGTVTVADRLPAGLSVVAGPLTLTGANAANWSCVAANTADITCTSTVAIAGNGGTSSFGFAANVSAANGTSVTNRARVGGGGDPNKIAPTPATAAACTANNTPAGCALDTDTVQAPNLSLIKTDGVTTVTVGGTTTYTFTVNNGGAAASTGTINIRDVLPTGLTFPFVGALTVGGPQAANWSCVSTSTTEANCSSASAIAAGGASTFTLVVNVASNAPTSVTNLARVGGGGDPGKIAAPTAADVTSTCTAPVSPATTSSDASTGCAADTDSTQFVNLSLEKDDFQPFMSVNGTTTYQFTIRNTGTATSTGTINFRDVLPAPMNWPATLVKGGANGANWTCTRNSATDVNCTSAISIPAGGSSVFTLLANVGAATSGTQYLNQSRVGGGGDVTAGKPTNPTAADVALCTGNDIPLGCAVDLNTAQAAPQIRLTKTHPDPQERSPGSAFAFTLTVRNSGGSASTGTITVVDVVPAGLTVGAVSGTGGFTCATAAQVITCTSSTALAAAATATITVNVTVAAGATNELVNRAKVGGGGDPQNNVAPTAATAGACVAADVPAFGCAVDPVPLNADLQITKQQRAGTSGAFQSTLLGVATGATVQFQIVVSAAAGSATVSNATFTDTVPVNFTGLSVVSATAGGGASGCAASFTGNVLSGSVASLPAGGTCTVLIQGTASTATASVTNTATVTTPAGINDANTANNAAFVNTSIGIANISITKTDAKTVAAAGTTNTYTIVVSNGGPAPADGAVLRDPAVPGLSCTTAPTCAVSSGAAACPVAAQLTVANLQGTGGIAIPALPANSSLTFALTCTVSASGS